MPISLREAINGGSIEVPTITGTVMVNVPKHSNTGRVLRLKGKGIDGADQLITLKVALPRRSTASSSSLSRAGPSPITIHASHKPAAIFGSEGDQRNP